MPDVGDVSWLRERLSSMDSREPWTIHVAVPRDYPAYARVLHPADRDRPVGRAWPPEPYVQHTRAWAEFESQSPAIESEGVSWGQTADAFGTPLHPMSRWSSLVAPGRAGPECSPRDSAGWRYGEPAEGELPLTTLTDLAEVLAVHTTTPDTGVVALWDGWGGLVGFMGESPSRAFLQLDGAQEAGQRALAHHNRMLGAALKDRFGRIFGKARWQPGIVSEEISLGPRLELPHRSYLTFAGGIAEFTSADWVLNSPWRDRESEAHGWSPSAQAPNLIWPQDRAWVMVSEIDWDSTIVAGSTDLVSALQDSPELEVFPIAAESFFLNDGDPIPGRRD